MRRWQIVVLIVIAVLWVGATLPGLTTGGGA